MTLAPSLSVLPTELFSSIVERLNPSSIVALEKSSELFQGTTEIPRTLTVSPDEPLNIQSLNLFPNVTSVRGPLLIPEDDRIEALSRRLRGDLDVVYNVPTNRTGKFLELVRVRGLLYPNSRVSVRVRSKPKGRYSRDPTYLPNVYDRGSLLVTFNSKKEDYVDLVNATRDLTVTSLGLVVVGEEAGRYLSALLENFSLEERSQVITEVIVPYRYAYIDTELPPDVTSLRFDHSSFGPLYDYKPFEGSLDRITNLVDAPILVDEDPNKSFQDFVRTYPRLATGSVIVYLPSENKEYLGRVAEGVKNFQEAHPRVQVRTKVMTI